MSDLIDRQAAIDFIDAGHLCNPNEPRWSDNEIVNFLKSRPSAQPEPCEDAVSRSEIIRLILERGLYCDTQSERETSAEIIRQLPSVQPTLYGYKIEHLAYIARVMEKEGVTAEYAVRTFDDMARAINMIIDEARDIAERSIFNGLNKPTGGD